MVCRDLSANSGLCDPARTLVSTANITVATDICGAAKPIETPEETADGENPNPGGSSVVVLVSVLVPVIVLCIALIGFLVWGYKYHHSTRANGPVGKSRSQVNGMEPPKADNPASSESHEAESLKSVKGSEEVKIEMGSPGLDDTAISNPKGMQSPSGKSPFVHLASSPMDSGLKSVSTQPGDGHRAVAAAALRFSSDSCSKSPSCSAPSSVGALSHCPSGMHPLDFSGVNEVPGATVFKNQLLVRRIDCLNCCLKWC